MVITLYSPKVLDNITYINCGITTPALSGFISLSGLNNLEYFRCSSNGLSGLYGYEDNTNLKVLIASFNKIQNSIERLDNKPLEILFMQFNDITGTLPTLPSSLIRALLNNNSFLTGTLPSLSSNSLRELNVSNCRLSGSIPSLSSLANLRIFNISNQLGATKFTGPFGQLQLNSSLTDCIISSNQISTWVTGGVTLSLGLFLAQNNNFDTASIDAILQDFVTANKITGIRVLNLGGTGNQPPSVSGIVNKNILISRGWTVTTN
jgi:hypothetical protein